MVQAIRRFPPLRRFALLSLVTLAAACATGPAPTPIPPPLPAPRPPAAVDADARPEVLAVARFAAVGDLLLHGAVKESAAAANERGPDGRSRNNEGYDALFAGVAPALRQADLAFANLETPVAPRTDRGSRPFVFNAPAALLPALRQAGIGLVSFANNHVYDQGVPGFLETLEQLEAAGLPWIGAGRTCAEAARARILEVNGIRVAFVGATLLFNDDRNRGPNDPCAFLLDEEVALREARAAREAGAELVILSAHWGVEYQTRPRQQEIDLAHRLLDGGFDAILGHHPHVLQPVEVYPTKDGRIGFVAYSLGNFISNQSRTFVHGVQPEEVGNTRDGIILRFSAVRKRYADGTVRTELANLRAEPVWTVNNALARRRDATLPAHIRVIHTETELARARRELAEATASEQIRRLQQEIELLEARRAITARILGEEILTRDTPQ